MGQRNRLSQSTLPGFTEASSTSVRHQRAQWTLGAKAFDNAFPFHIVLSSDGEIRQVGHLLDRLLSRFQPRDRIDRHFRFLRPKLRRFEPEAFALHDSLQVFLELKSTGLNLRGAMQAEEDQFVFLGAPHIADLSELTAYGLGIEDVAGNELLCEQLLAQHKQAAALSESERLNRELKIRESELLSRTRRLENQLMALREASAAKDRAERRGREIDRLESLGVMAGGLAHDFNNLLMRIQGNTELAMLMLPPGEPVHQQLGEAKLATNAAAALCQRMLDFAGKAPIYVETLDLAKLIASLEDSLYSLLPPDVELSIEMPEEGLRFAGDARQLRQMMLSLTQNAADALGERGRIDIELGVRFFGQSYLDMTRYSDRPRAGRYVYFEISDNGPGMSDEVIERVFDPFFTTRFLGRGMGLAIVFGTARRHGGCIDLVSELGKGTTVRVLLPVQVAGLEEQMRLDLD